MQEIVFGKKWFKDHQKGLLWLCNTPGIKYWFRWVLKINKDISHKENIFELAPNHYKVYLGLKWTAKHGIKHHFRADFRTHDKFGKRLFHAFYPLWMAMHILDYIILDREIFPQLNNFIRQLLISKSLSSHPIGKVKNAMTFRTQIHPIRNISQILTRFIREMNARMRLVTFFTRLRTTLSSSYSTMKSMITNCLSLPIHIFFSKSPDILFTSNPRFNAFLKSVSISNKAFRNLFSAYLAWCIKFFSPAKIALVRAKSSWRIFTTFSKLIWENFDRFTTSFTVYCLHILIIDLSFSMSTLTAFPDPDPETTTVDGRASRYGVDEAIGTIRAGAGNSHNDSGGAGTGMVSLGASSTLNQWAAMDRGFFLFDTSALTAAATISAAVLSFIANTKDDSLSGESSANSAVVLVASTPASNTDLVDADFSQVGTTEFGRTGNQSTISTVAYNDITMNASGIAAVSKTGVSKFALRYGWDFDNTITGLTWLATLIQEITGVYAEAVGTTTDPKLVVTYTAGETFSGSDTLVLTPSKLLHISLIRQTIIALSDTVSVTKGLILSVLDSLGISDAVTIRTSNIWSFIVKNVSSWVSPNKNTSTWSHPNKNTSNWDFQDKS